VADGRGDESRKPASDLSDEQIVQRVCAGDGDLFEILLRRYNQRVYRVARSVLRDDGEAEEVAQEAWVRAFDHLAQLSNRGRFATWLIRIVLYEAWAHARAARRRLSLSRDGVEGIARTLARSGDPEKAALGREARGLLEAAIDALPEKYRTVFVLRQIEELSTAEVARSLRLSPTAVKTRLHRARILLRNELARPAPAARG
jgi:RNA polymerase sigma-70 factor (ECF subfamily)